MLMVELINELNTHTLWEKWGQWYASERRSRKITQYDVAKETGIERTHISDIENGKTGSKRETVLKLLTAINADIEDGLRRAGLGTGELKYESDDEEEALRFYRGVPPTLQPKAKDILKAMSDMLANAPRQHLVGFPRSCVLFDPDTNVWYETSGQEITDAYRLRSLASRVLQRPTAEKVEELREKITEAKASH